jgi:acetylornithine deacetylase
VIGPEVPISPWSPAGLAAFDKIREAIQFLVPDYVTLLQHLVRIPSTAGNEAGAQEVAADRMRQLGLDTDVFDVDPVMLSAVPGFTTTERNYHGRPCVVGIVRGAKPSNGRSLVLNAHIDVAPAGDLCRWSRPPFGAEIIDGRLFGRGAVDDKAGIAVMLLVVAALRRAKVTLAGDVTLQSVIEDEDSGNGSLACVHRGHVGDGVIILDGTWPERIITAHMGQLWFTVRVRGRPAAACVASRGENPIYYASLIVLALKALEHEKNVSQAPWGRMARPVFVNIGTISAAGWPGAVPADATLSGQFGFCPPDTVGSVRRELERCLRHLALKHPYLDENPPEISYGPLATDPFVGDAENSLVRLLQEEIESYRSREVRVEPVTGHADLRHFRHPRSGAPLPACLYGPGGGVNPHIADEHYIIDHLPIVAENVARVMLRWCGLA